MKKKVLLTAGAALAATLAVPVPVSAAPGSEAVELSFEGLEPLGDELVYEGWLIIDGAPESTGTFNIDADGNVVVINDIDVQNAEDASAFVLTLEPTVDPDPAPSSTHILAGDFENGVANLTLDHPAALGVDLTESSGSFIIATPTAEDPSADPLSGVWFLDPTLPPGERASLDLPVLPEGWVYEGWAVIDGVPLSTGRFTDPGAADDFSDFSGPNPGPNYPGEDFLVNAPSNLTFPTDLTGATIVISVEPAPDDSPAPFALKPLVGTATGDVAPALQELGAGPATITGVATIADEVGSRELTGEFADATGIDGSIARLYMAVFTRQPDAAGHAFWVEQAENGMTLPEIAEFFVSSPEFADLYDELDNAGFVDLLYLNVLDRAGEAGGVAFWNGQLDSGAMERGIVVLNFSESVEFKGLTGSS